MSRQRRDLHGRRPATDPSRRSIKAEEALARVPAEELELVYDLLDDANAPLAQVDLVAAVEELLDVPHGTAAGKVSRALLWLHREGFIEWAGQSVATESGRPSNTWRASK
jgi:hypothetical protein